MLCPCGWTVGAWRSPWTRTVCMCWSHLTVTAIVSSMGNIGECACVGACIRMCMCHCSVSLIPLPELLTVTLHTPYTPHCRSSHSLHSLHSSLSLLTLLTVTPHTPHCHSLLSLLIVTPYCHSSYSSLSLLLVTAAGCWVHMLWWTTCRGDSPSLPT